MIERKQDRRAWLATSDRRKKAEQEAKLEWDDAVPAMAGTIRPGVTEQMPRVERRRFPEAGSDE